VRTSLHARWFAVLGALWGWAAAAAAELTWERTTFEAVVDPATKEVHTTFGFRNRSDVPITITAVTTDCDCTTAVLEKKTYSPGESGGIQVTFAVGGRIGEVNKRIRVETDQKSPPTNLTLRANIQTYVSLATRMVWWPIGAAPEAKRVRVTAGALNNLALSAIQAPEGFAVRSDTIEAGRVFDLVIPPLSTAAARSGQMEVPLEVIGVGQRTSTIYVLVK
jgi:hypothetical protein